MKAKFFIFIFIGILLNLSLFLYFNYQLSTSNNGDAIIELNNLKYEIKSNGYSEDKLDNIIDDLRDDSKTNIKSILYTYQILTLSLNAVLFTSFALYVYIRIIRPFNNATDFAKKVASGNYEDQLLMDRKNILGEFSWAFDLMRFEIKKSRDAEKEAIKQNKQTIAQISHDIKTPISSIKAIAELFEEDLTDEEKKEYLDILNTKSDEVTKLTNDLFIHSIVDIDKLDIKKDCINAKETIEKILFNENFIEKGLINILNEVPNVNIFIEEMRLQQIFSNIITNAKKYAKSSIDISFKLTNDFFEITFRDYGPGIDNSDLPFVKNSFYRGRNSGNIEGTGLGLYIISYILENVDGEIKLNNAEPGLIILVALPYSRNVDK